MDCGRGRMVGTMGRVGRAVVWEHSAEDSCGVSGRNDPGDWVWIRTMELLPEPKLPTSAFNRSGCSMHGGVSPPVRVERPHKLSPERARQSGDDSRWIDRF